MNVGMDARDRLPVDLQRETDALRRIARGVLFETALAEDAVQEAWLAALRAPSNDERSGGWLTEAVRRISRGMRRQESRRSRREHVAARREAEPSAADSAAGVELLRQLLDALEALEEPYRTVVQLRLVDDLSPRAIAARLGVPVETARTRIKRGVERLRARLDAQNADRRDAFLAALLPLAVPAGWKLGVGAYAGSKTFLGVLMSAQAKLATAAVIVLLAGALWWRPWDDTRSSASPADIPLVATTPVADEPAPNSSDVTRPIVPALAETASGDTRETVEALPRADWVIRGRALREKHQPIPGALIGIRIVSGYDGPGEQLHRQVVQCGTAGEFVLALPRADRAVRVQVLGNMPDYICTLNEALVLPGADGATELDAVCYPLDLIVRGRVLDPSGAPVIGARVQNQLQPVETDSTGHFELRSSCALEEVTLWAWADGFAEARASLRAHEPGVVEGIEIQLRPSADLVGRVVDEDGAAVPDARVKAFPLGQAQATSDRGGRFTLHGLSSNEHWIALLVQAEGFPRLRHVLGDGRIPTDELTLVLSHGVELSGDVVDETGRPLPGAELVVGGSRNAIDAFSTIAVDGGRFTFAALPRGAHELRVEADGCAPYREKLTLPPRGTALPLHIVLERGITRHGIVVDQDGAALPDHDILVRRGEIDYIDKARAKTGPDGRFSVQGLPKHERLTLEVQDAGSGAQLEFDSNSTGDLRVVVQRAAGLSGRVIDKATRRPVTAFRVRFVRTKLEPGERRLSSYSADWMDPGREVRDAHGRWDTRGNVLNAGEVVGVEISAPGYGPSLVPHAVTRVDYEREPIVFELAPGTTVRGRVIDARSGTPIAGARVQRMRALGAREQWGGRDPLSNLKTESDANGSFSFEGLPSESMMLAVEAAGFAPKLDGPFEPDASTTHTIELARGATLRGVLRDGSGQALAHEPISVGAGGGELGTLYRAWSLETDGEGRFELGDLMPATYNAAREVRYEGGSILDCMVTVSITEARTYDVELGPRGTGRVSGTIQVTGKAAPILVVQASRAWTPDVSAGLRSVLARDGRFELEGLESGRWHFAVTEPGVPETARHGGADADVSATGVSHVSIELIEH